MTLFAVSITHDGRPVDIVAAETADEASNAAFAMLHRLQGQSISYATTHGGWSVSEPYAVSISHIYGSAHFVSLAAAERYYGAYGETPERVAAKLRAGEIHIGKPTVKDDESARPDRTEGRYFVTVYKREG